MSAFVNVSGTWRAFTPSVKVAGTWRTVSGGWVKVAGVWRRFLGTAPALGAAILRNANGGTTSAVTAAFTPGANCVLLAFAAAKSSTAPSRPVISDSLGGTWTAISTAIDGPATNPFIRGALYYQVIGASPASMTVTASPGATSTIVAVVEVPNGGTDFTNFAINANTAGDPSCTIATPAAGSVVVGFMCGHLNVTVTPSAGFTVLYNALPAGATNHRTEVCYDITSPVATCAWTSTLTNSVGILVEVKQQ